MSTQQEMTLGTFLVRYQVFPDAYDRTLGEIVHDALAEIELDVGERGWAGVDLFNAQPMLCMYVRVPVDRREATLPKPAYNRQSRIRTQLQRLEVVLP